MSWLYPGSPTHSEIEEGKRLFDMIGYVADGNLGIPRSCPCGGKIITETCRTDIARSYFVCNKFQDDGLHFRKMWYDGVEEEVEMLRREVDKQAEKIRNMAHHELMLEQMRKELNDKTEEIAYLKGLVEKVVGRINV